MLVFDFILPLFFSFRSLILLFFSFSFFIDIFHKILHHVILHEFIIFIELFFLILVKRKCLFSFFLNSIMEVSFTSHHFIFNQFKSSKTINFLINFNLHSSLLKITLLLLIFKLFLFDPILNFLFSLFYSCRLFENSFCHFSLRSSPFCFQKLLIVIYSMVYFFPCFS